MQEENSGQGQSSASRLVRSTSQGVAVLAGGAAVLPPAEDEAAANETTPLNRRSSQQRADMQDQRSRRVQEEIRGLVTQSWKYIIAGLILVIVLVLIMMALLIWAFVAALQNQDKPCDQPMLKYYIFINVGWGIMSQHINKTIIACMKQNCNPGPFTLAFVTVLLGSPGWCIIGWGLWMILHCKTCQKTNPDLFYPTKYYIYSQIVMASVMLILSVVSVMAVSYMLLIISRLSEGPGCKTAVSKLPKVPKDSQELIDTEDGQVKTCPVCLESLASGAPAVRCPCKHIFHEDCLLTWCSSHLDCPLCRQEVGDPDGEERVSDAV